MSGRRRVVLGCVGVFVVVAVLAGVALWGVWRATDRGARIYAGLGQLSIEAEAPGAAAHFYRKALRVHPDDARLHVQLGDALAVGGETMAALDQYDRAKELDPNSPAPYLSEAWLCRESGAFDEALRAVEKAAELAPDDPSACLQVGRLLAEEAEYDDAVQALERAIELDGGMAEAYEWLGYVHEARGDQPAALRAYETGAAKYSTHCQQRLAELGAPGHAGGAPASSSSGSSGNDMPPALAVAMPLIFIVYMAFFGLFWLAMMGGWVATLLAVYDCARRDFPDPATRAVWCLLIVLTSGIGAVVYYFVVFRRDDPSRQPRRPPIVAAT